MDDKSIHLQDAALLHSPYKEENKRLKEILLAALPAIRNSYKACHEFYPYDGTNPKFLNELEPGKCFPVISNWRVHEEAKKCLNLS
jgi:hypothetical protein